MLSFTRTERESQVNSSLKGQFNPSHSTARLPCSLQPLNRARGIFQIGISAIYKAFFTTLGCVPQCRKEKPLSMCFHVLRAHCEFSTWPHFYCGHWTSRGLCRVAPGISQLWYSWPSITPATTMFQWRASTLWQNGACLSGACVCVCFFIVIVHVCRNKIKNSGIKSKQEKYIKSKLVCFGII